MCKEELNSTIQARNASILCIQRGTSVSYTHLQYRPFSMYVSDAPIDYGVVYRKVIPGYEVYSKMGIYERNLSSFEELVLLENAMEIGRAQV